MRGKTIRLYRIEDDGRRLLAGRIQASTPSDLVLCWRLFLATATSGVYVATYRGDQLGLALVPSSGAPVTV